MSSDVSSFSVRLVLSWDVIIKGTVGYHQLTEPDRTKVVSYIVGPNTGFKVLYGNKKI